MQMTVAAMGVFLRSRPPIWQPRSRGVSRTPARSRQAARAKSCAKSGAAPCAGHAQDHAQAAADSMAFTLFRTAHSTFVKETEDFTTGLVSGQRGTSLDRRFLDGRELGPRQLPGLGRACESGIQRRQLLPLPEP